MKICILRSASKRTGSRFSFACGHKMLRLDRTTSKNEGLMREVFQPIALMLGSETIHDKYRRLSSLCDLPREVSVRSGGSEDVSTPGPNSRGGGWQGQHGRRQSRRQRHGSLN